MRAVVYTRYGTPDVLELKEVERPIMKDDEVLIRVRAVSINDWDWALLQPDFINKLLNGFKVPKIQILGSDVAGTVEAAGRNVRTFKPGDDVFGDLSGRWGGFAEYVTAPEKSLAIKPAQMSFEEASAIPQAGMLCVQGLIDKGKIQSGQKILVNGAGGGVGTFAIQIGRMYGAEMTGVDSADKLKMLDALGYHHVIDYRQSDFTSTGERYDLILDTKTNRPISHYTRALVPHGKYVTVGGEIPRLLQALFLAPWVRLMSKRLIIIVALKPNKDLSYMSDLFDRGKLKPIIDGHYTLEEVPEAFRYFGEGRHKGKLVVTI